MSVQPFRADLIRIIPFESSSSSSSQPSFIFVDHNTTVLTTSSPTVLIPLSIIYFNQTNVTDWFLLFHQEGYLVHSTIDDDVVGSYTSHRECIDPSRHVDIACLVNVSLPTAVAGLHTIVLDFDFKLGPANDSRPSRSVLVNMILPDEQPGQIVFLSATDGVTTITKMLLAVGAPFVIGLQLRTASSQWTVPIDFFGETRSDREVAVVTMHEIDGLMTRTPIGPPPASPDVLIALEPTLNLGRAEVVMTAVSPSSQITLEAKTNLTRMVAGGITTLNEHVLHLQGILCPSPERGAGFISCSSGGTQRRRLLGSVRDGRRTIATLPTTLRHSQILLSGLELMTNDDGDDDGEVYVVSSGGSSPQQLSIRLNLATSAVEDFGVPTCLLFPASIARNASSIEDLVNFATITNGRGGEMGFAGSLTSPLSSSAEPKFAAVENPCTLRCDMLVDMSITGTLTLVVVFQYNTTLPVIRNLSEPLLAFSFNAIGSRPRSIIAASVGATHYQVAPSSSAMRLTSTCLMIQLLDEVGQVWSPVGTHRKKAAQQLLDIHVTVVDAFTGLGVWQGRWGNTSTAATIIAACNLSLSIPSPSPSPMEQQLVLFVNITVTTTPPANASSGMTSDVVASNMVPVASVEFSETCLAKFTMTPISGSFCGGASTCRADGFGGSNLCYCTTLSSFSTVLVNAASSSSSSPKISYVFVRGTECVWSLNPSTNLVQASQCSTPSPLSSSSTEVPQSLDVLVSSGRFASSARTISLESFKNHTVVIRAIKGCTDFYPSTADCDPKGKQTTLTIIGQNFNSSMGVRITTPAYGTSTCASVALVNSSTMLASGCAGFGVGGQISLFPVLDPIRSFTVESPATVSFRVGREGSCGRNQFSSELCSGNGQCNPATGLCECYGSDLLGYWAGPSCDICDVLHNNSVGCRTPCPIGLRGLVCSGSGECGFGICICSNPLAGGVACEGVCQTAVPGSACSGHGICNSDNKCSCTQGSGFFFGATCSDCAHGYSGLNCDLPCPADLQGNVCTGNGSCSNGVCTCFRGFCGDSCDTLCSLTCPEGKFGAGCQGTCPGESGLVCSGHGKCSEGTSGTGLCACEGAFGTASCGTLCPGGGTCSGHGQCQTASAECVCQRYFAGAACAITCPSTSTGGVCNGHGTCDDGVNGTGQCRCTDGYDGTFCGLTCPTINVSLTCSGHGICANLSCICFSNESSGFWAGDACDICDPIAGGDGCTLVCPRNTSGETCSGHGYCGSSGCECFGNTAAGFWYGAACDDCLPGFGGIDCLNECLGGACNPCSGHGVCSAGRGGTSRCSCVGNWTSDDCSTCLAGFYGSDCSQLCPHCSGTGSCNDGPLGDGSCACLKKYVRDAFGQCTICAPGYFGPSCAACAVSTLNKLPCANRGACVADANNSLAGVCQCDVGFGGPACDFVCPVDSSMTCGGHGICVDTGSCSCDANWTVTGAGGACSACSPGLVGINCSVVCAPCVNGSCDDGRYGTGTCKCNRGWWGPQCDRQCPGGSDNPCLAHGDCSPVTGECSCFSDTARGFFEGTTCQSCQAPFNSSNCSIACPATLEGGICNGRGACYNGACSGCASLSTDRASHYCGIGCTVTGRPCFTFQNNCSDGFWGTGCSNPCPGPGVCSGSGFCSPDNGTCFCDNGYFGTSCSEHCAVQDFGNGTLIFCSGNGQCVQGICSCQYGYFDAVCGSIGPGGLGNICSNRGQLLLDGTCLCERGYGGSACNLQCPQVNGFFCNDHGSCSSSSATCVCDSSGSTGFFTGSVCDSCIYGYGGGDCRTVCDPATSVTVGTLCSCITGYGGSSCSIMCPGYPKTCSGHGSCFDGSLGNGTCSCAADYYGLDCSSYCTVSICRGQGLANPQCNVTTGQCECQQTPQGMWAGPSCDTCVTGFTGVYCSGVCSCSSHGGCNQYTGNCACFADAVRGFWAGSSCSICQNGYIGVSCQSLNVGMSRSSSVGGSGSLLVAVDNVAAPAVIFDDAYYAVRYAGSNPIVIVRTTSSLSSSSSATLYLDVSSEGAAMAIGLYNATHVYVSTTLLLAQKRQLLLERNRTDQQNLTRTTVMGVGAAPSPAMIALRTHVSQQRRRVAALLADAPSPTTTLQDSRSSGALTITSSTFGNNMTAVVSLFDVGELVQHYITDAAAQETIIGVDISDDGQWLTASGSIATNLSSSLNAAVE